MVENKSEGDKNMCKDEEKDMSGSKRNGAGVRKVKSENHKLLEKYFTCLFLLSKLSLFLKSHFHVFLEFEDYVSEISFKYIKG